MQTITEAGLTKVLPLFAWFGFCMPSGVLQVVAKKLASIVIDIASRDETRQFLKTDPADPFPGDAAAFAKTQQETSRDWVYFVKLANIEA